MQTRESGMPSEESWQSFFDAPAILRKLGLSQACRDVVEFGCGYGTFTIPAARTVRGTVYAIDIAPDMLAATQAKVEQAGLTNVQVVERDFAVECTGLCNGCIDFAMLFNILHAEERMELLREAHRILAPGGTLAIVHWNYDTNTPRGPSLNIRPRPGQCRDWAEQVGFVTADPGMIDLPPYHYGYAFIRP